MAAILNRPTDRSLLTEKIKQQPSIGYSPKSKEKSFKNASIRFLQDNKLVVMIIVGALIGFIIGISINKSIQKLDKEEKYTAIIVIGFPGELLIRMLKLLILPLISCSLIVGLASLDSKVSGKVGARAVVYYLTTTCLAAVLGLMLVSAIRPGSHMAPPKSAVKHQLVRPLDSFMDIVRNMFPSNIVKACVEQDKTIIKEVKEEIKRRRESITTSQYTKVQLNKLLSEKKIERNYNQVGDFIGYTKNVTMYKTYKVGGGLTQKGKANFLGVIVFAIAVGIVAGRMGHEADVFIKFITVFNNIITKLVIIVMWYSPIGIMSLIIARFAEMKDIGGTFSSLGLFMVTVVVGIGIHGLIVLPLLFFIITRTNPFIFLKGMAAAMATAFGTDSSAATLPVTFHCLEENLKLDRRITRFILPVGTTINMDGTALYEAVSAIFIAQAVGHSLSFGDYVAISFTSILASIGAAAIPHAGLVTMLIVLDTVGLPSDMIAIIFSVDWFLDRCRTMINVLGDAYGTGIVQHLSKADLERSDKTAELEANGKIYCDLTNDELHVSSHTLNEQENNEYEGTYNDGRRMTYI